MLVLVVWFGAVVASVIGLFWAFHFYRQMMLASEGNDEMKSIAQSVRDGAGAYLNQQNKVVSIVFVLVTAVLAFAAFQLKVQSGFMPIAFLTGGLFSGLCGWFGMRTATQASSRTANAAINSLNDGLQIAFRSGAVMGLTVVGMGLLYICMWFGVLYWGVPAFADPEHTFSLSELSVTMLSFGMGASAQALFARVGGGIFTKAADVGADLVGKVEQSLKEDSPLNPATIADNVGDNVGDVAGMGADLYESYCGSILAACALGVAAFASGSMVPEGMEVEQAQLRAMMLPIAIAAIGILLSIVGIYAVRTDDNASQKSLLKALDRGINRTTLLIIVASILITSLLIPTVPQTTWFGFLPGVSFSIIVGLLAGWLIGKWTEYSTSDEYSPTQRLAAQAETGPATIIIGGIADGMYSVWFPVFIICLGMFASFGFASGFDFDNDQSFPIGLYGVGIAAVGMLSTLGITLATDAYGPIADNAGGNAEMAGLEPYVRERTDALDSLGNTTAATGKGFAIGSAALTALALFAASVEGVRDGMHRWAGDQVTQSQADGFYKLSDKLVYQKNGDSVTSYLVMPEPGKRAPESWTQIEDGLAIDEQVVLTPLEPLEGEAADAELASNYIIRGCRAPLVDVSTASLRNFLTFFDGNIINPRVLMGIFLGAMSTFLFCAMTMKSVGRAAQEMMLEVRRQFTEDPGILDGSSKPDYQRPIEISTKAAQREMILPSLLGLLMPIVTGLLLGVAGVLGLLAGCLTSGFCLAIFMANSGGSWDNAKKYVEAGHHGGKGTEAHKATVVGDTVGDPFKDTSGPSLNILIKLMSIVSVVAAGLIVRYAL
ncbi:putative K(+)-stimulated pyrophosphate-energized sodium pump [Novipirellula aureliae]|uniref:Putative K(+)-stimulated pyrophosphate-energized sodium pump n=1 Tax=Novipirellula aureliae TaxID=2527966 RepID=A0A5C6E2R3_9BACT|nr:sodium-translocating pyrophosphatase [Novipirellula aureliae]TWU43200.1 putative K(+)-stimulated pyrophosphate-energized sodium pump [Novipirellula aureliae]